MTSTAGFRPIASLSDFETLEKSLMRFYPESLEVSQVKYASIKMIVQKSG
jgi:hypothetical protein